MIADVETGHYPGLPRWASCNDRGGRRVTVSRRRCNDGSRGWSDEDLQAKEGRQPPEAREGREIDSPKLLSERGKPTGMWL